MLRLRHAQVGVLLLVIGEALILVRVRPLSDYYFPFVWIGFTLLLDAAGQARSGSSLFSSHRRVFLALFVLSAGFWWLFELLNVAVQNWVYVGAGSYTGLEYVIFASVDFSTVLAAVWSSARFVQLLLPQISPPCAPTRPVPARLLAGMLVGGVFALVLPLLVPRLAFGLIWVSLLFLLDPINAHLGRPSMVGAIWNGNWRLPLSFALGALLCGFCWEAWNFWSMPKWIYQIPYVGFWHVFEMPLLGYTGYLPFGLELFAMTNFVLPLLGFGTLTLESSGPESPAARRRAS